jgi:hypothetical protein
MHPSSGRLDIEAAICHPRQADSRAVHASGRHELLVDEQVDHFRFMEENEKS